MLWSCGRCISILDADGKCNGQPLYGKAREWIEAHPLPYQERGTRLDCYQIALFSDFLVVAVEEYMEKLREEQRAAYVIIALRQLYRDICVLLRDETQMEQLDLLFRQRFMPVPPMAAFVQGMTDDLLFTLTKSPIRG